MPALTEAEIDALLRSPTIARLGTVKPSGAPYVVPIWQHWDGENAYVIPRGKARFVPYLETNPRVALSVADDIAASHDRVLIEGDAEIVEGPVVMHGTMLALAQEMAVRYGGQPGLEYLQQTAARPRYLVRIVPKQIVSWRGTWHPRYSQ